MFVGMTVFLWGLMSACWAQNFTVPNDLSVVSFDNLEVSHYVTLALKTIKQPRFEVGRIAMKTAFELLEGNEVQDQILPRALVKRESTKAQQG